MINDVDSDIWRTQDVENAYKLSRAGFQVFTMINPKRSHLLAYRETLVIFQGRMIVEVSYNLHDDTMLISLGETCIYIDNVRTNHDLESLLDLVDIVETACRKYFLTLKGVRKHEPV